MALDLLRLLQAAVAGVPVVLPLMGRLPLSRRQVADSPVRQEMLRLLDETGGLPLAQLKERVGLGWGSFYHHLEKLQRAGHLEVAENGRRRVVYPVGLGDERHSRACSALQGATARRIAAAIASRPGCSVRDVLEEVGESPRVVYYHLKRLMEAGLVESSSPTRHFDLTAGPELQDALDALDAEQDEET